MREIIFNQVIFNYCLEILHNERTRKSKTNWTLKLLRGVGCGRKESALCTLGLKMAAGIGENMAALPPELKAELLMTWDPSADPERKSVCGRGICTPVLLQLCSQHQGGEAACMSEQMWSGTVARMHMAASFSHEKEELPLMECIKLRETSQVQRRKCMSSLNVQSKKQPHQNRERHYGRQRAVGQWHTRVVKEQERICGEKGQHEDGLVILCHVPQMWRKRSYEVVYGSNTHTTRVHTQAHIQVMLERE